MAHPQDGYPQFSTNHNERRDSMSTTTETRALIWHDADDYRAEYAETPDPRVLAIIRRDEEPTAPDGDALAPAYFLDGSTATRAGDVFHDADSDRAAEAYVNALDVFWDRRNREEIAARYLRIVHGVTALHDLAGGYQNAHRVLIFDTPSYREHVGGIAGADPLSGECDEWQAFLDGEVYGIGYAVNEGRVTAEEPVDFENGEWLEEIECWGFYGAEYARESAAGFEHGEPELAPLLDADGLVFA